MRVHQLANIVIVVFSILLEPEWQPVVVPASANELWITTYVAPMLTKTFREEKGLVPYIWWGDVGNIGVVGCTASKQADSGRAAQGNSAVVPIVGRPWPGHILLYLWHIVHRVKSKVLIVSHDKDDIRRGCGGHGCSQIREGVVTAP